ncbi:MAG: lysophospholipid acyltransferase family protein [Magnetococcales bacterium]|nr:lysophospholipid acyltransferase family protein [Magnetococcales bacterium]
MRLLRAARHRLEWLLLRGGMRWLQGGDLADAYARAHRLAGPLRHLLRSEWAWANTNLHWVYGPHITPWQRQRLAALAFENMLCSHLDGLRQDPVHWQEEAADGGCPSLAEAFALGRGVIVCSIHLGSWELGLRRFAALGYPIHVVYRHANNPLSEREFMAVRAAYGVQWIRRDEPRKMAAALRAGHLLVLMTDINQRRQGIVAPFLGIPAQSPPGAARLARHFQAPVVPMVCLRAAPGRLFVRCAPALMAADYPDDVAMTTQIHHRFEAWIHTYAEQYNWLHARWRSRPDGALWSATTPTALLHGARVAPHPPLSERVERLLSGGEEAPP